MESRDSQIDKPQCGCPKRANTKGKKWCPFWKPSNYNGTAVVPQKIHTMNWVLLNILLANDKISISAQTFG